MTQHSTSEVADSIMNQSSKHVLLWRTSKNI